MTLCPACGIDVPPVEGPGRRRVWCSAACKDSKPPRPCDGCGTPVKTTAPVALCPPCVLDRRRARWRRDNRRKVARLCVICAATFKAPKKSRKTCSAECAKKASTEAGARFALERRTNWPQCPVWFRPCGHCGEIFTSRNHSRKYCGDPCATSAKRAKDVEYDTRRRGRVRGPFPCAGCGTGQFPQSTWKCDECRAETRRLRRRRDKRRRRALKLGVDSESYTLAEISLRDGQRCGLCGQKVPMGRVVPHPKAPTIDHVVPLSRGGDDTRANVQLAHFICNSIKGDRGGNEQLALIG